MMNRVMGKWAQQYSEPDRRDPIKVTTLNFSSEPFLFFAITAKMLVVVAFSSVHIASFCMHEQSLVT